ncbi:MAG: recombinase family protein [Oscillospiraceae bacterium]|nr:recombinase family protein [Oscillospiraceae bacterium]
MKGNQKTAKVIPTGIYVRVSTEDQAQEGYSIRGQIEKLKSYALLKDWDIYDIYADEGISGKNVVDRPAINRLIDDIKSDKIKNVLVFKVDRLTRSTKNLIELVDLFEENNCAFNSLTESIDTDTPSGRMFLKIIGIFAEFERENLASRLKLGFERKAKEGYTLATNNLSYGYTLEKGQKIQQIHPDEARIVKEIFSMYVDKNKSLNRIARILNERKVSTKNNVVAWCATTIKAILQNPTHIGKVRYRMDDEDKYFESDGHHERIISDEMFYLAQERIKNMPNISRTKRAKEDGYFCGVLSCGRCNGKFSTQRNALKHPSENGEKYRASYRCRNKQIKYLSADTACECPDILHEKVEHAFNEYITKYDDFEKSEIDGIDIEDESAKKESELHKYITVCENKQAKVLSQKKRIVEQYAREELDFDNYKEMLAVLNDDYENLENELRLIKTETPTITSTSKISKEDIIANIKENWDYLNNTERMMFVQRFMKKIVINVEKERHNFNKVKVENIEFNLSSEFSLKNTHREKDKNAFGVRKFLRTGGKNKSYTVTKKVNNKRNFHGRQ